MITAYQKVVTGRFSEVHDPAAYSRALSLCRGCYQRDLVRGHEAISGSTLKGKAKNYGARYQKSAYNLLKRLREAGIMVNVATRENGRRVLVIG